MIIGTLFNYSHLLGAIHTNETSERNTKLEAFRVTESDRKLSARPVHQFRGL
jgi:hypothetical protein